MIGAQGAHPRLYCLVLSPSCLRPKLCPASWEAASPIECPSGPVPAVNTQAGE